MGYTRFKGPSTPATLATLATFRPKNGQSVAKVATVATVQRPYLNFEADRVATVAAPDDDGREQYSGPFAAALKALQLANPTDDTERWACAKTDARAFLEQWGDQAALLGWTDLDLFGLHPTHPLVRYDCMGVVWLLRGRQVVSIEGHRAKLSHGQNFYRGHWPATINEGQKNG